MTKPMIEDLGLQRAGGGFISQDNIEPVCLAKAA
jgi:hypothetical protein